MFNNCRFASSSLNYSYFSKKYYNYDTFLLAIGLNVLTFWRLINVLSDGKFVSRFLPDLLDICNFSRKILYLSRIGVYVHHIWLYFIIIKLRSDIEESPGTKRYSNQSFSICHWNFNSITAHNYLKISLIFILRYILTLPQHLMIKILKSLDITHLGPIMHLIERDVVFVYIIKVPLLWD